MAEFIEYPNRFFVYDNNGKRFIYKDRDKAKAFYDSLIEDEPIELQEEEVQEELQDVTEPLTKAPFWDSVINGSKSSEYNN